MYELNKFYTGRIKRDFKTVLRDQKRGFLYGEVKSIFADSLTQKSQEMRNIEEIISNIRT